MTLFPTTLKQLSSDRLGLTWNDGHESYYQVRRLRLECRCAGCIEEWTRRKIIREDQIPQDVKPKNMESVGRYAVRIQWSDGHNTGIYTFDQLRSLCECELCKNPRA